MRTGGIFLALLGATSFLFPLMNRRSLILSVFGEYERIAAIAAIVLGALLVLLSFRRKKVEEKGDMIK